MIDILPTHRATCAQRLDEALLGPEDLDVNGDGTDIGVRPTLLKTTSTAMTQLPTFAGMEPVGIGQDGVPIGWSRATCTADFVPVCGAPARLLESRDMWKGQSFWGVREFGGALWVSTGGAVRQGWDHFNDGPWRFISGSLGCLFSLLPPISSPAPATVCLVLNAMTRLSLVYLVHGPFRAHDFLGSHLRGKGNTKGLCYSALANVRPPEVMVSYCWKDSWNMSRHLCPLPLLCVSSLPVDTSFLMEAAPASVACRATLLAGALRNVLRVLGEDDVATECERAAWSCAHGVVCWGQGYSSSAICSTEMAILSQAILPSHSCLLLFMKFWFRSCMAATLLAFRKVSSGFQSMRIQSYSHVDDLALSNTPKLPSLLPENICDTATRAELTNVMVAGGPDLFPPPYSLLTQAFFCPVPQTYPWVPYCAVALAFICSGVFLFEFTGNVYDNHDIHVWIYPFSYAVAVFVMWVMDWVSMKCAPGGVNVVVAFPTVKAVIAGTPEASPLKKKVSRHLMYSYNE
eukprot:gene223-2376_t